MNALIFSVFVTGLLVALAYAAGPQGPALRAAALGAAASARAAQHETASDIQEGSRVFRNSCANCHGPDGDQIAGVDLGSGEFKRAQNDADLVRIIRIGIPGTPMPATNMSEDQAARVVSYLRSVAAARRTGGSVRDDAVRGKAI